ncbi:MAG: VOC family protein [Actinomycetota bacterium]|nr:VOC family protein [Actinomycetota bacterium]
MASVSLIVKDPARSRSFYEDGLDLEFEGGEGDYVFTERLPGVKHFGLWPLSEAAMACFGRDEWPDAVPVPTASVEFEVEDVSGAVEELEAKGYQLIHGAKTEPWTQVTARLMSPEGVLVAVCYTPWFHQDSDSHGPQM